MVKRLTDTDKWNKRWFRKLPSQYKCFWNYICDRCNHAGVWEKDFELAGMYIGKIISEEKALQYFGKHIIEVDAERWYLLDFIEFQYKCEPNELNPDNKAHRSVITIMKRYQKLKKLLSPFLGAQDKNKNMEKKKRESPEREKKQLIKAKKKIKKKAKKKRFGEYRHVLLTIKQYKSLLKKWGQVKLDHMIKVLDEGIEMKGYKYKNHNLAIQNWAKRQGDIPDMPSTEYEIEDET